MSQFSHVFFQIISVLLSVIVGFSAGKLKGVERDSITSLLFFFISPIVFFAIPASSKLGMHEISVALVTFFISTTMSVGVYYFAPSKWQGKIRNMLAISAGTVNAGYFMLPVASTIFDDYTLTIYTMLIMGLNIFEISIGYYLCFSDLDKGFHGIVKQMLRLPTLHAFVLGCLFSIFGFNLPDFFDDFVFNMRSTYSVLGMIMIGLSLSKIEKFEMNKEFTLFMLAIKFILYPFIANLLILLDKYAFHLYDNSCYQALQLISVAPIGANTIIIASMIGLPQERMATTVIISCVVALIYVPLMVSVFYTNFQPVN